MNPSWFSVRRRDSEAIIRIHDEIDVTGDGASKLLNAVGDAQEIEMHVNSIGGGSLAALEIFDALRSRQVITTITGRCYSSAVTIALTGRRIRMERTAQMMIHSGSEFVRGTPSFLRTRADALEKLDTRIHRVIQERTKQPAEIVGEWLSKDTWFTADEAWAAGLIDEVFDAPKLLDTESIALLTGGSEDDGTERLLLEMLRCLGIVRTRDKAKLIRELQYFAATRIQQT